MTTHKGEIDLYHNLSVLYDKPNIMFYTSYKKMERKNLFSRTVVMTEAVHSIFLDCHQVHPLNLGTVSGPTKFEHSLCMFCPGGFLRSSSCFNTFPFSLCNGYQCCSR